MKDEIIRIISAFVGTLGFAVLFNIRGKRLVYAALGGLLSWSLFEIIDIFINNEVIIYFVVALLSSFYAEIMARILKTPTTAFIITSLIPLIPGSSLYYTMAYAFHSDVDRFMQKGIYTLELASSLALGIIIATTVVNIVFKKSKHTS